MAKFIKLHANRVQILVNLDCVAFVVKQNDGGCGFIMNMGESLKDNAFEVDEKYEDVKTMVAVAQGGLPMSKCRTKEGAPG